MIRKDGSSSRNSWLAVPKLKEKLDKIFSQYIRLRDSDENGYCKCISCGSVHFWKDTHNGHYENRSHMATRFNERNCNAQCVKCNIFEDGNLKGYKRGLIRKYDIAVIGYLEAKRQSYCKITVGEYRELIGLYTKRVNALKIEKNL